MQKPVKGVRLKACWKVVVARDGQRSRSLILIFKITTGDLDLLGEKITSGDLFKLILIFDL